MPDLTLQCSCGAATRVKDPRTSRCGKCRRRHNPVAVEKSMVDANRLLGEAGRLCYQVNAMSIVLQGPASHALAKMGEQLMMLELELLRYCEAEVSDG